jgi:hypothetical protein
MAGTRHILVRQNEDFIFAVRWKIGGVVQALSDASFTIRVRDESIAVIIEATVADGRLIIDGDDWVRITIPVEDLELIGSLQPGAVYDIRVTRSPDGVRKVLLEGKVSFDFGATR